MYKILKQINGRGKEFGEHFDKKGTMSIHTSNRDNDEDKFLPIEEWTKAVHVGDLQIIIETHLR